MNHVWHLYSVSETLFLLQIVVFVIVPKRHLQALWRTLTIMDFLCTQRVLKIRPRSALMDCRNSSRVQNSIFFFTWRTVLCAKGSYVLANSVELQVILLASGIGLQCMPLIRRGIAGLLPLQKSRPDKTVKVYTGCTARNHTQKSFLNCFDPARDS